MKLVNRSYLFGPMILLCVLISMSLAVFELYPGYTDHINKKAVLIERISTLSKEIDSTNAKILVVANETQVIRAEVSDEQNWPRPKIILPQATPSRNPTRVSFVSRLEIWIGEFSSYKSSVTAYNDFRQQNDIDCTIIELVKDVRYLLVAENPKKFHSRPYVPGEVVKLSRSAAELGMRPIFLSAPNAYSFLDGK